MRGRRRPKSYSVSILRWWREHPRQIFTGYIYQWCFGASWIYQAHVEDPDPDFSYQEIQIALWIDLTENVFNGQIIESIEFGTGSVSELFEEEDDDDEE